MSPVEDLMYPEIILSAVAVTEVLILRTVGFNLIEPVDVEPSAIKYCDEVPGTPLSSDNKCSKLRYLCAAIFPSDESGNNFLVLNTKKSYSRFRPLIHIAVLAYDNLKIDVFSHDCKTKNTFPALPIKIDRFHTHSNTHFHILLTAIIVQ